MKQTVDNLTEAASGDDDTSKSARRNSPPGALPYRHRRRCGTRLAAVGDQVRTSVQKFGDTVRKLTGNGGKSSGGSEAGAGAGPALVPAVAPPADPNDNRPLHHGGGRLLPA